MEHKAFLNWELKQLTEDDRFFYIEGFASTPDVDLGDDIVEAGCVLESYKSFGMPKFCHQHEIKSMPLGIIEDMSDFNGKPQIRAKMPKNVSLCKDVAELAKIGAYGGLSIGYKIIDAEMDGDIRRIKKLHVFEISLVTMPMNPNAVITSVKTVTPYKDLPLADRKMDWDSGAADKRVREFTKSTEKPSATYKNAFLWYDEKDKDTFGAYKLPYADVVDGKLKAVPRGIFAASGGRGVMQTNIPEEDKKKVVSNINKYYAKMRKIFEDESIVSPFEKGKSCEVESLKTMKDIELFIKDLGVSNKEAKTLISKIKSVPRDEDNTSANRDDIAKKDIDALNSMLEDFKQLI